MLGHASVNASSGSSSGHLPAEHERLVTPQVQTNSQAMPADVLDKLLVIYFTHVHVSVYICLMSTADRREPLANHLQASLYYCKHPNTTAECDALRGSLCCADIRARPLR